MTALSAGGILFTAIWPLILTTVFVSPATADTLGACVKNNSGNIKMADSAADCKNNEYFISWNDQGPIGLTGPAGADGNDGVDGQDGAPGATGPQGPIGITGPVGADGNDGVDGQDGAPGDAGPQGPIGLAGTDGTNGVDGHDGLACWDLNGDGLQDTGEDINNDGSFNALDCAGPQGAAGATGAQGPQGDVGPVGVDGATGPQGPIGMTGPAGAGGNDGVDGQDGAQGPIGLTGPAGAKGDTGDTGPQGPIGMTGPAGNGSIESLIRSYSSTSDTIPGFGDPVPVGVKLRSSASCPSYTKLIGGGCVVNDEPLTNDPNYPFIGGEFNNPSGWQVSGSFPLFQDGGSGPNYWACEVTCGAKTGYFDVFAEAVDENGEPSGFELIVPTFAQGCSDTTYTSHAICLDIVTDGCDFQIPPTDSCQ